MGRSASWFFGDGGAFEFFVRHRFPHTGIKAPPVPPRPPTPPGAPAHNPRYRGVGIVSTAPYQGVQVHLRPDYEGVRVMVPLLSENKPTPEADSKRERGRWVIRKGPFR